VSLSQTTAATQGHNLTVGFLVHCCVINGDTHSTVTVSDFGQAMAIFSKFVFLTWA